MEIAASQHKIYDSQTAIYGMISLGGLITLFIFLPTLVYCSNIQAESPGVSALDVGIEIGLIAAAVVFADARGCSQGNSVTTQRADRSSTTPARRSLPCCCTNFRYAIPIIASLVIVVDQLLRAYAFEISKQLGGLLVTAPSPQTAAWRDW